MINYILFLLCFVFIVFLYFFYKLLCKYIFLNKYKNVIELFDFFCTKSYTIIYKDQIIGYTSNGITSIPVDEYETIQRNFIKLIFKVMGKRNVNLFINFFGTRESFITNIMLFLKEQINNDELYKLISNVEETKEKE